MSRGRAAPALSAVEELAQRRQMEHDERRAALLSFDPALIRFWAQRWGVPLIDSSDEDLVESAHAAIMRDGSLPPLTRLSSARHLAERGDEVAQAMLAELERQQEASEAA
jgi:hypothetical protein